MWCWGSGGGYGDWWCTVRVPVVNGVGVLYYSLNLVVVVVLMVVTVAVVVGVVVVVVVVVVVFG